MKICFTFMPAFRSLTSKANLLMGRAKGLVSDPLWPAWKSDRAEGRSLCMQASCLLDYELRGWSGGHLFPALLLVY